LRIYKTRRVTFCTS